jgi:hypothetical protein
MTMQVRCAEPTADVNEQTKFPRLDAASYVEG